MKMLPIIAQYIYDGEDLGRPYTKHHGVLCDFTNCNGLGF